MSSPQDLNLQLETVQKLRDASAIPAPILHLPAELLLNIVALATEDYRLRHDEQLINSDAHRSHSNGGRNLAPRRFTPVRASHVCRQWYRQISNCPALWSTLVLDGVEFGKMEAKIEWFSTRALGRSIGGQNITTVGPRSTSTGPGLTTLVFKRDMSFPSLHVASLFTQLRRSRACANLRHVRLLGPTARDGDFWVQFWQFTLAHGTTLRSLDVHSRGGFALDGCFARLANAFPSLEHLLLSDGGEAMGPTTFLPNVGSLLPAAQGQVAFDLKSLTMGGSIQGVDVRGVEEESNSPCTFPQLRQLELTAIQLSPPVAASLNPQLETLFALARPQYYHINRCSAPWSPAAAPNLQYTVSLKLSKSQRLTAGLLTHCVDHRVSFQHLVALNLNGTRLTQAHLDLFDSSNAPNLVTLDLSDVMSAVGAGQIGLPLLGTLRHLKLNRTDTWLSDQLITSLSTQTPQLVGLDLSGNWELPTAGSIMRFVQSRRPAAAPMAPLGGWSCTSNHAYDPTPPPVLPVVNASISGLRVLIMLECPALEPAAVQWLKGHMQTGGLVLRTQDRVALSNIAGLDDVY